MNDSTSFLFPKRIERYPCVIRFLIVHVAFFIACGLMGLDESSPRNSSNFSSSTLLWIHIIGFVFTIPIFVCLFRSVYFPRLRDIGLHTAYSIFYFIPPLTLLLILILFFVPSDAFAKPTRNA